VPNITRDNFDRFWFGDVAPSQQSHFRSVTLKETPGSRPIVETAVVAAIYDHHMHPDRVAGSLRRLGYQQAATALLHHLPKEDTTRKGNFGEVVASEHLRQRYGLNMPVFKLRYADHPQMPQRGEDLIAFEIDTQAKIITLCIGEAKVRSGNSSRAIRDAHARLAGAFHPYPVALSLISSVLHDQGQHALADQIDELMETVTQRHFPHQNWIFIITEQQAGDAFQVLTNERRLEALTCVHISLDDLEGFITKVFESPIPKNFNAD
jgi:Cap4 SAVED domain